MDTEPNVDKPATSIVDQHAKLTVLGSTVRESIEHVEVFPAPANVDIVRFTTDELS